MASSNRLTKKPVKGSEDKRSYRNFPHHALEETLVLPQKIQDEMGGQPMNRLLLADGLGLSPSSSNFRNLLSSSFKYGLTEGTEKADQISLTPVGNDATQHEDQNKRLRALRMAAMAPDIFGRLFRDYASKRLPSSEMLPKILSAQYHCPFASAAEAAAMISANGKYVAILREIGGSPHILLDADLTTVNGSPEPSEAQDEAKATEVAPATPPVAPPLGAAAPPTPASSAKPTGPRPIFVGHGKNKAPLQQLQKLLTTFQIAHKVVVDEANLGRPIPQKVKEVMEECGSAILIFTRDERFFDAEKNEVWRPSENVVHELGAASFAYGDRIVIFKEKGLHFPTNFQSIGYIEFESDDIQARTADLLKELIGFGLVRVTPT